MRSEDTNETLGSDVEEECKTKEKPESDLNKTTHNKPLLSVDVRRSRRNNILVDVDKFVKERHPMIPSGLTLEKVKTSREKDDNKAKAEEAAGRLLREVYSGGTFKRSTNYLSFMDKEVNKAEK